MGRPWYSVSITQVTITIVRCAHFAVMLSYVLCMGHQIFLHDSNVYTGVSHTDYLPTQLWRCLSTNDKVSVVSNLIIKTFSVIVKSYCYQNDRNLHCCISALNI